MSAAQNAAHPGTGLRPGARRHPDRAQPFRLGAPVAVPEVSSLAGLLAHWAAVHAERPCVYFIDLDDRISSLSWTELARDARRWAGGLAALGVRPTDRVMLALPTGPALLIAFFACQWLGALPCIVDEPARGRGLAQWCERLLPKLSLLEPRTLLVGRDMLERVRAQLRQAGPRHEVEEFEALDAADELPVPALESAGAILQFTSGTTSRPKAVVCSHSAVLANLRCIGGEVRQFHEGDLMVGWLPLFHDMGLVATTLAALAHGLPVALMSPAAFVLRPARWLWTIHALRGSLTFAPNFAYQLCLRRLEQDDAELTGLDLSSLRTVFNAAEFVHADTARTFMAQFAPYGLPANAMTPAYGMAEMAVGVSSRESGRPMRIDVISRAHLGSDGSARGTQRGSADALEVVSLGRVFAGHELAIHDETGRAQGERQQGEIVLRGPSLFSGYYGDVEATREVLREGWLRTGDLGYLADGEVFITGRAKDLIIRGGENHHPHLLEEAAGEVAGVRAGRVAAVGLLNPLLGTEEIAVLAETGETDPEALRRIRREIESSVRRVSGLQPDHVLLVRPNLVPVTSSGKIRRGSAREAILEQLGRSAKSLHQSAIPEPPAGLDPRE